MRKGLLVVLSFLSLAAFTHGDLIMKISADATVLSVGDTTTVRVFGWAQEAQGTNGLYDWSVSAYVSTSGIVSVNSATALQPFPLDASSVMLSSNIGSTGNIDAAAAIALGQTESTAGVGCTELFNFQIEAIAAGSVQYALRSIIGDLMDGSMYDDYMNFNVQFDQAESSAAITVVPEPSSLVILAALSGFGLLTRKRSTR